QGSNSFRRSGGGAMDCRVKPGNDMVGKTGARNAPYGVFMAIQFSAIRLETPTIDSLGAHYAAVTTLLDSTAADALPRAGAAWEKVRREVESWQAQVEIRFQQDTGDAAAKAAQAAADALKPVLAGHESAVKRRLLEHPDRAGLARLAGAQALRL